MASWKTCGNCSRNTKCPYWVFCEDKRSYMIAWEPIPCPLCGGILSEIREHNGEKYRHCYACHFEYEEET